MIIRDFPTLAFATVALLEAWLSKHHHQVNGIWIKMAKKATGIPSVTHDEALEVALCYGWIDGQRNAYDDTYFLQKFTPRRSKSLWSKRNIEKVPKLISSSRMQPSGLAEVEAAKLDGRWEAAYDSSKNMVVPDDFLKALEENKQAKTFFKSLNKSNVYTLAWRLQTAKKPETRQRRFDAMLTMLNKGEFR
jgi:uncharacterized protein YdeI (YjbR/CyaY-like superfamily)